MSWEAELRELAYVDHAHNSDKFYRTYLLSDPEAQQYRVLFQWGRRGSKGQNQVHVCRNLAEARSIVTSKLDAKERNGYQMTLSKTLPAAPTDLLLLAGIAAFDDDPMHAPADPFDALVAEADRARRLSMGEESEQAQAVVALSGLRKQLDDLRRRVTEAEGHVELVEMVLVTKMGA